MKWENIICPMYAAFPLLVDFHPIWATQVFTFGDGKTNPAKTYLQLQLQVLTVCSQKHGRRCADVVEKTQQPFEMLDQLLCRVMLYRLSDNRHLFAIIPHQLIFDGWSFDIFLSELEAYYTAAIDGHAATLEPLSLQFLDFADWSAKRAPNSEALSFHRRTLDVALDENLPFNPKAAKGACQRLCLELDRADLSNLEAFCETYGLRIHEVLIAALCQSWRLD